MQHRSLAKELALIEGLRVWNPRKYEDLTGENEDGEEFLHDLKESRLLIPDLKDILKEFLHHCDLVKFAKHTPTTGEIQKTFDTCKVFISTTEDVNARIEEPVAAASPETLPQKEVS